MKQVVRLTSLLLLTIVGAIPANAQPGKANTCMENPGQGKLLVIIGQKIDLQQVKTEKPAFDAEFVARYKVLQKVCGNYERDTIEFTVYDHYGRPLFEKYPTVMLYLVEDSGKIYHEKYQFHELYKTNDGRWASPYDYDAQSGVDDTTNFIMPVALEFAEEVSYDITGLKKQDIRLYYPEPYYRIADGKAIAVYGNYVDELFEIKKRGVLHARGFYGVPDTTTPPGVAVQNVIFSGAYKVSKKNKKLLVNTWNTLLEAIVKKDTQKIKQLSLDSVICSVCEGFSSPHFYNDVEPIDTFITATKAILPGTELWDNMTNGDFKISATDLDDIEPSHFRRPKKGKLVIYEVSFKTSKYFDVWYSNQTHTFQFVKVKGGFKFYGVESQ